MKILFIKPPNHGFYHEIVRYYPVGLAYLAAACRENQIYQILLRFYVLMRLRESADEFSI